MVEVVIFNNLAEVEVPGKEKKLVWVGSQTFTITHLKDDGKTIDTNAVIDDNKDENDRHVYHQIIRNDENDVSRTPLEYNGEKEEFVLGIEDRVISTDPNASNNNEQQLVKMKQKNKNNKSKKTLNKIKSSKKNNVIIDNDVRFVIDESSRNSNSDVSVYCPSESSLNGLPNTTCEFCLQDFPSIGHKKQHKKMRHYYCVHCNKQYHDAISIQQHPCAAKQLKITSTKKSNESKPKKVMKMNQNRKVRALCSVCNKGFPTHYMLKRHSVTHTGERPYKCDTCNRTFTQVTGLNRHKLNANCSPYDSVTSFTCQECNKNFKDIMFLQLHQETHHSKEDDNDNNMGDCSDSSSFTTQMISNDDITSSSLDDRALSDKCKILVDEVDYTCTADYVKQMFSD